MGDIEKSILSLEDAVRLTPDGHTDKPGLLNNLGNSLLTRFEHLGEIANIDKAILSFEDAAHLTPDGHTNKQILLNNLGTSLMIHFERLGEKGDIEKAASRLEEAVRFTPDGHAYKPHYLTNLGNLLFMRFQHLGDSTDLKQSIFAAFQAATQSSGPPSVRFNAAITWSKRAHLFHSASIPSVLEAYSTAFELLPQVCWLGLSIAARHHELIQARTLACDAAATAISANNLWMAIEWLEQGRSVLWGQILHLRTPLDDLNASNPGLAAKLTSIAGDLERGSSQAFLEGGDSGVSPEQAVQWHRQLADKWEAAVEEVRKLPNFECFLLPKQYSELQNAGHNGPVVVVNASRYRCDALIIAPPQDLQLIHLDKLTYEHADSLRNRLHVELRSQQKLRDERAGRPVPPYGSHCDGDHEATFRDILGQLWELVVKPILGRFETLQVGNQIGYYALC